jgi:hypothetical protein
MGTTDQCSTFWLCATIASHSFGRFDLVGSASQQTERNRSFAVNARAISLLPGLGKTCSREPNKIGREHQSRDARAGAVEQEEDAAHKQQGISARCSSMQTIIESWPGARFLEECRGQQSGSCGDLFRRGGLPLLKPPGDSLYKHRRDKVWYKLV